MPLIIPKLIFYFLFLLIVRAFSLNEKINSEYTIGITKYFKETFNGNLTNPIKTNGKLFVKQELTDKITVRVHVNNFLNLNILAMDLNKSNFWPKSEVTNQSCFYGYGLVFHTLNNVENCWAALTICSNIVEGMFAVGDETYILEGNASNTNPHGKQKRSNPSPDEPKYFTLTQDTFELISLPQSSVKLSQNEEELGYFYDSAWKSVSAAKSSYSSKYKNPTTPQRYLEIVIAIDESVITFHGKQRAEQYVLTLMNIANALYQDPSLEAKLQLAIKKIYLYDTKKHVIALGNAKKSLENVNAWNKELHLNYGAEDEPHDIALWLTRVDIGGPSGYAPVGGVCDPERSCALTRDEGLTCAFIIAHELAHILGLSHDGDPKNGNDCHDAAQQGSVMAPMVSATFHQFIWSDCSRKEFASKVNQWDCLSNVPDKTKSVALNSTVETKFTMDEQCRAEFGNGYTICKSFAIAEPCTHLWCGHVDSPLVCKTKKGPPLEGTECGQQKWCIDGYCNNILRIQMDPLKFNPQDGAWSDWSIWNACSRTCGLGMQFRTRECNNPRPAYGGKECEGFAEEWQLCNEHECIERKDFRAQQCLKIPKLLNVPWNYTWLPYESKEVDLKCKYICQNKETNEIYVSDELLTDGTLCSYDYDNQRCVQGNCVIIGCDNKINSTRVIDACGVCGGNGSNCSRVKLSVTKTIRKQIVRMAVLPNYARHVTIDFELYQSNNSNNEFRLHLNLFLKDRQRNIQRIDQYNAYSKLENAPKKITLPKKANNLNDVLIESNEEAMEEESIQPSITETIVQGAKFRFQTGITSNLTNKNHKIFRLSTRGPILTELILFIEMKKFPRDPPISMKAVVEYSLHKKYTESKYEWIKGGWGSCSKSCGGGKMFKTKACVEKNSQRIVSRKYCSLINKPATEIQTCNNFSCNYAWIPGEWQPCTTTCGSQGTQHREIYCAPQKLQNQIGNITDAFWKFVVSPSKCGYRPPAKTRPCARTFCPGYWEFGQWSKCSTSCEYRVQMRTAICKILNESNYKQDKFSCGTDMKHAPKQYKLCTNEVHDCNFNRDLSPLCRLDYFERFCRIDSFRAMCLDSCSLQKSKPVVI